jgi:hypothetical protein
MSMLKKQRLRNRFFGLFVFLVSINTWAQFPTALTSVQDLDPDATRLLLVAGAGEILEAANRTQAGQSLTGDLSWQGIVDSSKHPEVHLAVSLFLKVCGATTLAPKDLALDRDSLRALSVAAGALIFDLGPELYFKLKETDYFSETNTHVRNLKLGQTFEALTQDLNKPEQARHTLETLAASGRLGFTRDLIHYSITKHPERRSLLVAFHGLPPSNVSPQVLSRYIGRTVSLKSFHLEWEKGLVSTVTPVVSLENGATIALDRFMLLRQNYTDLLIPLLPLHDLSAAVGRVREPLQLELTYHLLFAPEQEGLPVPRHKLRLLTEELMSRYQDYAQALLAPALTEHMRSLVKILETHPELSSAWSTLTWPDDSATAVLDRSGTTWSVTDRMPLGVQATLYRLTRDLGAMIVVASEAADKKLPGAPLRLRDELLPLIEQYYMKVRSKKFISALALLEKVERILSIDLKAAERETQVVKHLVHELRTTTKRMIFVETWRQLWKQPRETLASKQP